MALTGNRILCNTPTGAPYRHLPVRRPFLIPCWSTPSSSQGRSHIIVSAAKKGRFESKNRTGSLSTKEKVKEDEKQAGQPSIGAENDGPESPIAAAGDAFVMPELPGKETDFWEGPQWDAFGFFLQYLWAFGIVFALIACGIAVTTYNDGATDFKETPAYKESVQSQELLEGPEASDSDVFESNPTEEAPSLE
ncbi:PREDICTED: uncharacterized protein LOC109164505 [Ipomoea nil]|uniref:uncharacterized protein LOC109164505 n=1 Tax=Ipomoea nil TaxID=35883 RepID=UPI000900CFEC|nr:PREDICTED: uncharacterized protein LOC109164505 [Ipomoea nil]